MTSSGSTWWITRAGPNRLLERRGSDQLAPACSSNPQLWVEAECGGGAKLFSGLFLVSSLFPSLVPPPRCSLSLGQWQEEVVGPEMASLSWCERGLGVEGGGADGWRPGCRHLAVVSCVHVTYTHKEEDQTIA